MADVITRDGCNYTLLPRRACAPFNTWIYVSRWRCIFAFLCGCIISFLLDARCTRRIR